MKKFFLLLIFCSIFVAGVSADKCVILEEQGHNYLVISSQTPTQVSAYTVQMNTSRHMTKILDVLEVSPYIVVSHSDTINNYTKVSGFVGNPAEIPPPGTLIKLAEIFYSGDVSEIEISVLDLEGAERNQINVENTVVILTPHITPTLLTYNSNRPQYLSPGFEPPVIHVVLSDVNAQQMTLTRSGTQPSANQSLIPISQPSQNPDASGIMRVQTTTISGETASQNSGVAGTGIPISSGINSTGTGKPLAGSVFIAFLSLMVAVFFVTLFRK